MSGRAAFVWDDAFTGYDFGPEHPMQPVRLRLTYELARLCGAIGDVVAPRAATRAELERIHTPAYLDTVERLSREVIDPFGAHGFGLGMQPNGGADTPAFRGMHDVGSLIAGGSITGAECIWRGEHAHAFNHAGGLHHAMADRASGFCVYNDASIAIAWLLDNGARRVAYVDVDVHHGDGVQAAFYDDPRVLTISLHETGYFLFPGTGFPNEVGAGEAAGTKVNVALPPYTHDDAYRAAFERIVPPLVEWFGADVLVTQLGCDTHATDPLAHLALSTRTYRALANAFHGLAHAVSGGRWLALGGGGYQKFSVVPRAWTIYAAQQAHAELPADLPHEWMALAADLGARRLYPSFEDPEVVLAPGRAEEATERARSAAEETAETIFPLNGLNGSGVL